MKPDTPRSRKRGQRPQKFVMVSSIRYDQFGQKRGRIIDNVYHLSSVVKYGLDRLVGFLPIFLEGQRARSAWGTFYSCEGSRQRSKSRRERSLYPVRYVNPGRGTPGSFSHRRLAPRQGICCGVSPVSCQVRRIIRRGPSVIIPPGAVGIPCTVRDRTAGVRIDVAKPFDFGGPIPTVG